MDDGAVVAIVHVADSLFQEIGYLYVGKFTLKRSGHIKNQIGVGGAFYHPEIVDGKAAIQIVGNFLNLGAHVVDLLIVCDDRVNVDGCGAVQFVLEFVLDIVNLVMDDQQVSMFRYFGV